MRTWDEKTSQITVTVHIFLVDQSTHPTPHTHEGKHFFCNLLQTLRDWDIHFHIPPQITPRFSFSSVHTHTKWGIRDKKLFGLDEPGHWQTFVTKVKVK